MKYLALIFALLIPQIHAANPGKEEIGQMEIGLIFATDGDPAQAGKEATKLPAEREAQIRSFENLKFSHYRHLGTDTQPILRSYENWATPLKPSQEILLSFEPQKRLGPDRLQIDLEYWQGKVKLLKTNPTLRVGKPLYLLGPAWRGGRLLILIKIAELSS